MARITDKQLKKLREAIKFKGTIVRGIRWKPAGRKAKKSAKAWTAAVKDRIPEL